MLLKFIRIIVPMAILIIIINGCSANWSTSDAGFEPQTGSLYNE